MPHRAASSPTTTTLHAQQVIMPSFITTAPAANTNYQDTTCTTLLSLPVEIRACILEQLLLVAPSPCPDSDIGSENEPITVYSEDLETPKVHGRDSMRKIETRDSRITAFYSLALCNKTLSYEAASMFYQKLTFEFAGVITFHTVNFWLKTIGPGNRGHLTKLWLKDDDILLDYQSDNNMGSQFALPFDPMDIEKFFELLADTSPDQQSKPIAIIVFLEDGEFPELPSIESEIPNLMENFRALHTTTRDIGVLYHGCASRDDLKPELLREMGWEVIMHDTTNFTDYNLRLLPIGETT